MIPEAAVEAAAKAYFEMGGALWEDTDPDWRAQELADFRKALEAAAPHMLAAAFDHGRSVQHYTSLGWSVKDAIAIHADKAPDNPYRGEGAGNQHFELHLSPCRAEEMGL